MTDKNERRERLRELLMLAFEDIKEKPGDIFKKELTLHEELSCLVGGFTADELRRIADAMDFMAKELHESQSN